MDELRNESLVYCVFDRGYFDFDRLYQIAASGAFLIIREKKRPIVQVMQIQGRFQLTMDDIIELFTQSEDGEQTDDWLLKIDFEVD